MENYLIAAIVAISTALVTIFGLLMKAYRAVGEQKDLRLKAETAHNAKVEEIRADHNKDLEEIRGLLQSRSMNARKPSTERREPDDTS